MYSLLKKVAIVKLFQREMQRRRLPKSLSWARGLGVGQVENRGRACKGRCLETLWHNLGTRLWSEHSFGESR